jgi:hypothetical protein
MDDLPSKRGQGLTPVGFSDYGIESFHHNHRRQRITLAWVILSPGLPFSITLVLAVDSSSEIQSIHRRGNPICSMTSINNGQATESKAFCMSSFSSTAGPCLVTLKIPSFFTLSPSHQFLAACMEY